MLQYLHSSAKNQQIKPLERLRAGSWVRCERPNEDELAELLSLGLDNDLLRLSTKRVRAPTGQLSCWLT